MCIACLTDDFLQLYDHAADNTEASCICCTADAASGSTDNCCAKRAGLHLSLALHDSSLGPLHESAEADQTPALSEAIAVKIRTSKVNFLELKAHSCMLCGTSKWVGLQAIENPVLTAAAHHTQLRAKLSM